MKKIISGLCFILVIILVACGSKGVVSDGKKELSNEKIIKDFIKLNLEYTQNEDIDAVVSQIDCTSINCADFKLTMEDIFEKYDLKYEIIKVKINDVTSNTAEVVITQKTTKVNGPEFRDNQGEFLHTLIKIDNNWKFKNTKINKVEYLD